MTYTLDGVPSFSRLADSGWTVAVGISAQEVHWALLLLLVLSLGAGLLESLALSGMSGYELAAALRAAPHRFTGLLVALTGYGEQSDIAQALRSGFDAHLTKPVEPQVLLDLLATRMRQTG